MKDEANMIEDEEATLKLKEDTMEGDEENILEAIKVDIEEVEAPIGAEDGQDTTMIVVVVVDTTTTEELETEDTTMEAEDTTMKAVVREGATMIATKVEEDTRGGQQQEEIKLAPDLQCLVALPAHTNVRVRYLFYVLLLVLPMTVHTNVRVRYLFYVLLLVLPMTVHTNVRVRYLFYVLLLVLPMTVHTNVLLLVLPMTVHTNKLTAIAIDPASQKLYTGSHDGTVKCWSTSTGEPSKLQLTRGFSSLKDETRLKINLT
eukprot:gene25096-10738_t